MTPRIIAVVCVIAAMPAHSQRGGRYMPPSAVQCDRNNLTAYTGEVTRYSRAAGKIVLTMKTDADTVETVTFQSTDTMLLNAQEMTKEDWKQVEEKEGKLKRGMRATAWICKGGRPVLDWQPPAP
jgi:hypothetical protein